MKTAVGAIVLQSLGGERDDQQEREDNEERQTARIPRRV